MLKNKIISALTLGSLVMVTLSGGTKGAEERYPQQNEPPKNEQNRLQGQEQKQTAPVGLRTTSVAVMGQPFLAAKASDLIGRDIKGSQDSDLGEIEDLAIDTSNGRVVAVVIGRGGFLGVGQRFYAVPPQHLNTAGFAKFGEPPTKGHFGLNLTPAEFEKAPVFDSTLKDHRTQMHLTYQHFKQPAYWLDENATREQVRDRDAESTEQSQPAERDRSVREQDPLVPDRTTALPTTPLVLAKASDLIGKNVDDNQKKAVGEIKDFMVDLNSGRILFGILASGGVLGVGETLYAIPPKQLSFGSKDQNATLLVSKAKLDQAPQIKDEHWSELKDPTWVTRIYSYYNETVFWNPDSRQPVREYDEDRPTLRDGSLKDDPFPNERPPKENQD